jgi:hypothetical protein
MWQLRRVEIYALFCRRAIEVVDLFSHVHGLGLHLLGGIDAGIYALHEVTQRLVRSLYGPEIIRLGSVKYGVEDIHARWLLPRLSMKGYRPVEGEEG